MTAAAAKGGRRPHTGRFDTREELCEAVWGDYINTPRKPPDIAKAYKVSSAVVNRIINTGEGHPYISRETDVKSGRGRPKGSRDAAPRGGQKLSPDDVREIRRIYDAQPADQKSFVAIVARFPQVSKQSIEQIAKRITWKNVE